jgi:phospholipid-translocating ATPase
MCILSQTYNPAIGIYSVRDAFIHNFGPTLSWWVIILLELAALLVLDLAVQSVRRVYFPTDVDLMQRIEKDVAKERRRKAASGEKGEGMELEQMAGVVSVDVPQKQEQGDGYDRRPAAADQGQGEWRCNPDYYFDHVDSKQQQQQQPAQPKPTHQQTAGMNFSRPISAAPPSRDHS